LTDSTKAKKYIADYFENLYQAREGEESHAGWTQFISESAQKATNFSTEENFNPFSTKELNKCIMKLKRNKSTGPDMIPNEAIKEADQETRTIILEALNRTYASETIPAEWQHGEIIRIYKGKGIKGKCSNERGITLSSNMGKIFERMLDQRIKNSINITEAQAGGQRGKATSDHLLIINSLIQQNKLKHNKTTYIALLDVTKAYDKAWNDAIIYTANSSGIEGKNLRIMKKLNENLNAKIKTKHGYTRNIKIRDSIRQGGVLSVIEYANIMDEIPKELSLRSIGSQKLGTESLNGCLLWMDDVALINEDAYVLQEMLDTTNEIAKRYHLKFGKEKSQTLTIGKSTINHKFRLGDMDLEPTNNYKYLGMTLNSKGNLEDHLKKIKGKTEAAFQTILNLTGNDEFHKIEMSIIWKLITSCIIPIITYGAEVWIPTKQEINQADTILQNILKRILKLPVTTPKEIVIAETNIWDIETYLLKKQLTYYHRIRKQNNRNKMVEAVTGNVKNAWMKQIRQAMEKTNIQETYLLAMNKKQAKKHIHNQVKTYQLGKMYKAAINKSKVRDYVCLKNREDMMKRSQYKNKLNRTQCANLVNMRARMMKIRGNYKNQDKSQQCRWCKAPSESQMHIMTKCPNFKSTTENIIYSTYFKDDEESIKTTVIILREVFSKIQQKADSQSTKPT
jgi:hypothetical protein